jgi:hypothetical protein
MLQDALTWLEERARNEAPALLEDIRRAAALAAPSSITLSLLGDPVSLEGTGDFSHGGDGPTEEAPRVQTTGTSRYVDLGRIGQGGMGEVRRVRDVELNRVIAMKQVRADGLSPAALARFVEEVQITAQLQHPNIVPVYDSGRTADGGVYFTMKE